LNPPIQSACQALAVPMRVVFNLKDMSAMEALLKLLKVAP